jgi:hypothetical protein
VKRTMIAVAAAAMSPYAGPVYDSWSRRLHAFMPRPPHYDERVIRRGPIAREVVVTEPQPILEPAPGIVDSNW